MSRQITTSEEWRTVPGYPDYEVSDAGRVRSFKRGSCRVLGGMLKKGYRVYDLYRPGCHAYLFAHRLVLLAFVGTRPDGMECRHLNGVRDDNRVENLQWSTHADNMADLTKHGTSQRGDRSSVAKLTWKQAREIRSGRMSNRRTAALYGVSHSAIGLIRRGVTWKES